MSNATRITTTTLVLFILAATCHAQEAIRTTEPAPIDDAATPVRNESNPPKQWVWLEKQGLWGFGYQIKSGPHKGLWRIDPGTKCAPAPVEPPSDPYRFTTMLNHLRAAIGLQPVSYDDDLTAWAAQNNAAQCRRGLGHHVNPNCYQNSAWNTPDASSTLETWLNSPGHRENLLSAEITRVGLAYGPGPYWTMNAR
jgi:hypothetical protein